MSQIAVFPPGNQFRGGRARSSILSEKLMVFLIILQGGDRALYFFIPAFTKKTQLGISKNETHTLSQYFIELKNNSKIKKWVHLQLYGYNDILKNTLKKRLGIFYFLFE